MTEQAASGRLAELTMALSLPDSRFVKVTDCGQVTYAEHPDHVVHGVGVRCRARPPHRGGGRLRGRLRGRRNPVNPFDGRSPDGTPAAVWLDGEGQMARTTDPIPVADLIRTSVSTGVVG